MKVTVRTLDSQNHAFETENEEVGRGLWQVLDFFLKRHCFYHFAIFKFDLN